MRTLKFRAWDRKKREWYGSSSENSLTFNGFDIFGECTMVCPPALSDLQHLIVTQFVGFQDKDGKDIYEGDIIEKREYNGQEEKLNRYKVVFDEARFCLESCSNGKLYSFASNRNGKLKKERVFSNIYEVDNDYKFCDIWLSKELVNGCNGCKWFQENSEKKQECIRYI